MMYEPSADARASARALRDFYNALILEGFTEEQALLLLTTGMVAQGR